MLFRLLALWLCLIATSLHMVGARAIAITNGIEERVKTTYTGGKAYSIVTDQLGTPTEAYNAEGDEVWSRRLDMNGNILEENYDRYTPYSEQIRIPFLFHRQYYDHETELAYNRFRYYSPELGRYISEDSIRLVSGTLALHSYVEDVNSWVDVYGLNHINELGRIGEYNAGIIKNTTRIPSVTGKKAYRIPDAMSPNQRHIIEVKNVSRLHFTSQLKDDIAHITRSGGKGTLTLIVDNRTKLSKPLQNEINLGRIKLERKDLNRKVGYK